MDGSSCGLYVHVPFCVRKCLYCDFYSLPTGTEKLAGRIGSGTPEQRTFLDALELELKRLPNDFQPSTIFVGGGTPTELCDDDFSRLLAIIRSSVDTAQITEWTCEANPGTLTQSKAEMMRDAGVNRVSLGVQSFDKATLEFLNRIHTPEEAEAGYELLRSAGFNNINLDLIFGVPGSDLETHIEDVRKIIDLNPEHCACYCLTFEEGTPLYDLKERGFVRELSGDQCADQYHAIRQMLMEAGYRHYEISNFSRKDRECRHNLLYWSGGRYIGCGPAAHTHWKGTRSANVRNLDSYCKAVLKGKEAKEFTETLSPEEHARETLVMSLRRIDGVAFEDFIQQTDFDYLDLAEEAIERLTWEGLLDQSCGRLRLTEKALFISDTVFSQLI